MNTESRSAIVPAGAPSWDRKSVNLETPTNAATNSANDHLSPITLMVCGNSNPAPLRRSSDRLRFVVAGTERSHDPLGPHWATTSFSLAASLHAARVTCGVKPPPQVWCRMPGNFWVWAGTHRRSHPRSTSTSATASDSSPSPDTPNAAGSSGTPGGSGVRRPPATAAVRSAPSSRPEAQRRSRRSASPPATPAE